MTRRVQSLDIRVEYRVPRRRVARKLQGGQYEPHSDDTQRGGEPHDDPGRSDLARQERAELGPGHDARGEEGVAEQARRPRVVDEVFHDSREGGENQHEMRGGRGDVQGEPEQVREHRHVDDSPADPGKAGEAADENAESHAERELGRPQARDLVPPGRRRGAVHAARDRQDRGHRDEQAPERDPEEPLRDEPCQVRSQQGSGDRGRCEQNPRAVADPPLDRIRDGSRGGVHADDGERRRGDHRGTVIGEQEDQEGDEDESASAPDDRPVRAHDEADRNVLDRVHDGTSDPLPIRMVNARTWLLKQSNDIH